MNTLIVISYSILVYACVYVFLNVVFPPYENAGEATGSVGLEVPKFTVKEIVSGKASRDSSTNC